MVRRSVLSAALVTAVVLSLAPAAASAAATPSFGESVHQGDRPERPRDLKPESRIDPDTVLVKFDRGMSEAAKERAAARRGAKRVAKAEELGYELLKARGKAKDMVRSFQGDPQVEEVSPNYIREIAATPNDPAYTEGYQNYLKTLRLPEAWNRVRDARSQVIAVVDTGVDGSHDDLSGRLVAGYNAIKPGSSSKDGNGHGTMVAGVAAAGTNNGMGVAGAAWLGRIMPIKVLNSDGSGQDWHIVNGIRWAAGHGAKVINVSLGGFEDNPALRDAVAYATSKGALVVAAAGNFGANLPVYPAAYPQVLAVGATDHSARLTDFSSWGSWVDVAAPGFDIVGPWLNDEYYILAGTSFSAPLVSGIAALARARYPGASPSSIHSRIRKTARDAGPRGIDPYYGWGFVDAYHTVGGDRAADFALPALGSGEPNGVPSRATPLTSTAVGTIAVSGDVDWYRIESTQSELITVSVTPPPFDENRAGYMDPVLALYDDQLSLLGESDSQFVDDTETVSAVVGGGPIYVKVRNYNGSADPRAYEVSVVVHATDMTPGGAQEWVSSVSPYDFATGQSPSEKPKVQFARDVDPASVTSSTVRLLHGRTGSAVSASVSYDLVARLATVTPSSVLSENTPYRIVVEGVKQSGATMTQPFSTTFQTVNYAPPKPQSVAARGYYKKAKLTWTLPNIPDLRRVVVRMAEGTSLPSSPGSGKGVHSGSGTSVTVTGLMSGKSYSFRMWVQDRADAYGSSVGKVLRGTKVPTALSRTTVPSGGSVTVSGKLLLVGSDNPIAGKTVVIYTRKKGTSTWNKLASRTTSSSGSFAVKNSTTVNREYWAQFAGSSAHMGARGPVRTVRIG